MLRYSYALVINAIRDALLADPSTFNEDNRRLEIRLEMSRESQQKAAFVVRDE